MSIVFNLLDSVDEEQKDFLYSQVRSLSSLLKFANSLPKEIDEVKNLYHYKLGEILLKIRDSCKSDMAVEFVESLGKFKETMSNKGINLAAIK